MVNSDCSSIELKALGLNRGGLPLLRHVNMRCEAGSIVHIAGPNGSGKSSLLKLLNGMLKPVQGEILVNDIASTFEVLAKFTAYINAHPAVIEGITCQQYLCFINDFFYEASSSKTPNILPSSVALSRALLDEFGLGTRHDMRVAQLSSGQRKRLEIARLRLLNRPIWLLDELFSGLDTKGRDLLCAMLKTHCQEGGMVLLAEHILPEIGHVMPDINFATYELDDQVKPTTTMQGEG